MRCDARVRGISLQLLSLVCDDWIPKPRAQEVSLFGASASASANGGSLTIQRAEGALTVEVGV